MTTAVVTGAGSGIGAALCRALARCGMRIIAADIDATAAAATCAALATETSSTLVDQGGAARTERAIADRFTAHADDRRVTGGTERHVAVTVDVTDADAVEQLAACFDPVDLWINNAGIAIGGATEALALADWRRVLDVNLAGVVHGVHAIYPRMVRRRAGHIVNIASVAGLAPYPLALPYTTSKHAVVGLSQALRAEAARHGVRVSVACPGMIQTPIWERSEVRGSLARGRSQILARLGAAPTADDCAQAIVRGIAANRGIIPITVEAHVAWWLARLSPALAARVSERLARHAHRVAGAQRRQ